MPAIVTNKFRIHNAKQFVEAFDEVAATSGAAITDTAGLLTTNMYLFIGKVTAWADDTAPPTPTDSVSNTVYNHWRDMIAAKKIGATDVSHVVPRYNWTSGSNYYAYNHANNALFDQQFYVMTDDYNVYKCLSNNNSGGTSTTKPSGTGTAIIETADTYAWKFMYQVSAAKALKFVTPSYMPVQRVRKANLAIANTTDSSFQYDIEIAANTSGNGAIEVCHVTTGGSAYKFEVGTVQSGYTETTTTCKISGAGLAANQIVNNDIYFTDGALAGTGGTITGITDLTVADGGTGVSSFTVKSVIVSDDSTATADLAPKQMDGSGELLIGGSSGPEVGTITGGNGLTMTVGDGSIAIGLDAALTTVTSMYNTALKVGRDARGDWVDFGTDDNIKVYLNNAEEFRFASGGTFHADADVVAYSSTVASDMNLKKNITDMKYGLDTVMQLRGVEYDWKREDMGHDVGVLAQEVEAVIPELVKEHEGLNGRGRFKSVDYNKLVPILIESIKELKTEVDSLRVLTEIEEIKE